MAGALSTYTLLGMGIGGMLAGWLSDRIGRVRVTWWAVLVFSVCTGAHRVLRRLLADRGDAASSPASASRRSTASGRCSPPSTCRRGSARPCSACCRRAGRSAMCGGAALGLRDCRATAGGRCFSARSFPASVALVMLRGVPDPPSWCRGARAQRARGAVAASSPRSGPTARCAARSCSGRSRRSRSSSATTARIPGCRAISCSDLGVNLQNMGWYVAGTYAMMVLGKVVTGYLADVVRPHARCGWSSGVLTAVYLPILITSATPDERAVSPADLRAALRRAVRRQRHLHERELPGEHPRHGRRRRRTTSAASARRSRRS